MVETNRSESGGGGSHHYQPQGRERVAIRDGQGCHDAESKGKTAQEEGHALGASRTTPLLGSTVGPPQAPLRKGSVIPKRRAGPVVREVNASDLEQCCRAGLEHGERFRSSRRTVFFGSWGRCWSISPFGERPTLQCRTSPKLEIEGEVKGEVQRCSQLLVELRFVGVSSLVVRFVKRRPHRGEQRERTVARSRIVCERSQCDTEAEKKDHSGGELEASKLSSGGCSHEEAAGRGVESPPDPEPKCKNDKDGKRRRYMASRDQRYISATCEKDISGTKWSSRGCEDVQNRSDSKGRTSAGGAGSALVTRRWWRMSNASHEVGIREKGRGGPVLRLDEVRGRRRLPCSPQTPGYVAYNLFLEGASRLLTSDCQGGLLHDDRPSRLDLRRRLPSGEERRGRPGGPPGSREKEDLGLTSSNWSFGKRPMLQDPNESSGNEASCEDEGNWEALLFGTHPDASASSRRSISWIPVKSGSKGRKERRKERPPR